MKSLTLVASEYCIENCLGDTEAGCPVSPYLCSCNGRDLITLQYWTIQSIQYCVRQIQDGSIASLFDELPWIFGRSCPICLSRIPYHLTRNLYSATLPWVVVSHLLTGFICTALRLPTHLPSTFSSGLGTRKLQHISVLEPIGLSCIISHFMELSQLFQDNFQFNNLVLFEWDVQYWLIKCTSVLIVSMFVLLERSEEFFK